MNFKNSIVIFSAVILFNSSCGQTGKKKSDTMTNNHNYTNELINESSPYLLQHAHNPVNWYPWGEKAFTKSKSMKTKCSSSALVMQPATGAM